VKSIDKYVYWKILVNAYTSSKRIGVTRYSSDVSTCDVR